MITSELLQQMREANFIVTLNSHTLEVRQARWIDDELADLIRIHKLELINILENEGKYE